MSKILAIETSTDACSAALLVDDVILERYQLAPKQHTQLILPMVKSLLAEAGLTLSQLDTIAFGRGPGSFTGVRIAAGITQGLAFGADLPVIPVSSLQALAQKTYEEFKTPKILAGFDARMQEVYWGVYQLDDDIMTAANKDILVKPEEIKPPQGEGWVGVGDAWESYEKILCSVLNLNSNNIKTGQYPSAGAVAKVATRDWLQQKVFAPDEVLPLYLRSEKIWS